MRAAIAIIESERIVNLVLILISTNEANGMVAWPIVQCVGGRRTRKRLSLYGPREQMEPFCHEDYPMQPILLHLLARMMLMIEIVEVVEVMDMYIGIKTKVHPVLPVVSLT